MTDAVAQEAFTTIADPTYGTVYRDIAYVGWSATGSEPAGAHKSLGRRRRPIGAADDRRLPRS